MLVERVVDAKLLLESDLEGTACAKIPADGIVSIQTSDVDASALTYGPDLVPKDQVYQVVSDPLNRAGSTRVKLSGVGETPHCTIHSACGRGAIF